MTGAALLTVIATILSVESGMVEIDLGRNGGLQAGDEGAIFYEIGVGNEVRSIEVGKGTVTAASGYTAMLQTRPDLAVRSGYLVRFEIPVSRVSGGRSTGGNREPSAPGEQLEAFVVDTDGSCLNVRPLPSTVMPAIACVSEGARVLVIDSVSDWKKARLSDGREGWVATQFLSARKPDERPAASRQAAVSAPSPARTAESAEPAEPRRAAEPTRAPRTEASAEAASEYPMNQRAAELADQLRATDSEVNALIEETSRGHSALSEAERRQTELRRRLLETMVSDLETRLTSARQELAQSRDERSNLIAQIAQLESTQERLHEELADSEVARREIAAEAERLQARFAETQSNYESARSEQSRLERELAASRSALAQLEVVAEAAKEALRNEIRHSETSVAALREQLAEKSARIEALEAEREAMETQVAGAETGLSWWRLRRELRRTRKALRLAELARAEAESRLTLAQAGEPAGAPAVARAERTEVASKPETSPQDVADVGGADAPSDEALRMDDAPELGDSGEDDAGIEARGEETRNAEAAPLSSVPMASGEIEDLSSDMVDLTKPLVVLGSAEPCLNFRAKPSLDSTVFECLEPGTTVGPVGRWEGWHYVKLADQRAGWVSGQHVGPVGLGGGSDAE